MSCLSLSARHTRPMRALTRISTLIASAVVVAAAIAQPQYQIFDIGVIQVGDTASQGFGASPGGVAVGRSITSNSASQAFTWTIDGGRVALPNLAGRPHAVSNDANDSGIVVGHRRDDTLRLVAAAGGLEERRCFAASSPRRRNDRRRERSERVGRRGRFGGWRK